jgi:hypothetical protein
MRSCGYEDVAAAEGFCLKERPFEDRVELFVDGDLTIDIAIGPAEIGPQLAQRLASPFDLLRMTVALATRLVTRQ